MISLARFLIITFLWAVKPLTRSNFVGSVKKALTNLKEQGDATNPGYGHWRIQKADAPIISEKEPVPEPLEIEDTPHI
jgi:hypothetical protein